MRLARVILTGLASLLAVNAARAMTFSSGEADISVRYQNSAWTWSVQDSDFNITPLEAALFYGVEDSEALVPSHPGFHFLGAAGDPVWILPSPEKPGILFLGIDASATGAGVFANNQLNLTLMGITGPGHFALYSVDAFGSPRLHMSSRDGFTLDDTIAVPTASGHVHANWAFSAPGDYTLFVQPSGVLSETGQMEVGPIVEWRFTIVPEPGTTLLVSSGIAWLLTMRRHRPSTPIS